jgi:geranylgeranyl diphosphate synthase type II
MLVIPNHGEVKEAGGTFDMQEAQLRTRVDGTRPRPVAACLQGSLDDYMSDCRALVLEELERQLPKTKRCRSALYDLILEYPLRDAKALRPTLCIATALAFGAQVSSVVPTACVFELYHNAFLIHDDVEDDSDRRRNGSTLHRTFGVPVAMNVGDAMLALALTPLLDNLRLVGLSKSLRVMQIVSSMARHSAEGQALELAWCRRREWNLHELDYFRLVRKKTSHYTFIAPVSAGAVLGGTPEWETALLRRYAAALGTAFQIQDDVLNLTTHADAYGKDRLGDLWEGKHTLIVLHMLAQASTPERRAAMEALARPRSTREASGTTSPRSRADVELLYFLIEKYGSIAHARSVALRFAQRALASLHHLGPRWRPSVHRDVLVALTDFIVNRTD